MAHLKCECEHYMNNTVFPNQIEGRIRGDYDFNERIVWECPFCGRLQIDVKDQEGTTVQKSYIPEDGVMGHLFGIDSRDEELIKYVKKLLFRYKEAVGCILSDVLVDGFVNKIKENTDLSEIFKK